MDKNKILLLFPDGVGIRNYLYSDVFKDINKELVLFHNFDPETVAAVKENAVIDGEVSIPEYKESVKEKFFRELICLSRLYYNNKRFRTQLYLVIGIGIRRNFQTKFFIK